MALTLIIVLNLRGRRQKSRCWLPILLRNGLIPGFCNAMAEGSLGEVREIFLYVVGEWVGGGHVTAIQSHKHIDVCR